MTGARYPRDISNRERALLKAFGRGRDASEREKLRCENPHMPPGELYAAWDCGWCDAEEVYVVAQGTSPREG